MQLLEGDRRRDRGTGTQRRRQKERETEPGGDKDRETERDWKISYSWVDTNDSVNHAIQNVHRNAYIKAEKVGRNAELMFPYFYQSRTQNKIINWSMLTKVKYKI